MRPGRQAQMRSLRGRVWCLGPALLMWKHSAASAFRSARSGCGDHEGGQDGAALFSAETDDSFPRWMESSSELFTNLQSWLPSGAPSVSAEKTDLSLFSQMHLWEVREISEIFLQNHTRLLD